LNVVTMSMAYGYVGEWTSRVQMPHDIRKQHLWLRTPLR